MSATSQYLHLVSATRQKKNRNEYLCWIVSNYWLNSWLIKDLINDVNAWSPKDDVEVISDAKIHNACGGCWNSTNHVHSWKGVLNSARDGILQITWPDRCCVGLHEVLVWDACWLLKMASWGHMCCSPKITSNPNNSTWWQRKVLNTL